MRFVHLFIVIALSLGLGWGLGCSSKTGEIPADESDQIPATSDSSVPDSVQTTSTTLPFFYAIHLHLGNDRLPYDSKLMKEDELNADKAENMLAIVNAIKAVADKHGLPIDWQPTVGPAKGFCVHQGSNHVFKQLLADGHGVGIHAHNAEDLEPTFTYLREDCGLDVSQITTASGYQAFLKDSKGPMRVTQFTDAVTLVSGLGIGVGTSNIAPYDDGTHDMAPVCTSSWGDNTDAWKVTDNLLLPWKPDIANKVPCDHDPKGEFVMVDHSGPEWMVTEAGKANSVRNEHFDQLRVHFDAALDEVAKGTDGKIPAWGFVTHISEFTLDNNADGPPDQVALEALDTFLTYVSAKRDAGLVEFALASHIAERAYPDNN
mgnify:CR=1 FL=1